MTNRWGSNLTIVSEDIQLAQWYHIAFFTQYNQVIVNGTGYTGSNYTIARMTEGVVAEEVRVGDRRGRWSASLIYNHREFVFNEFSGLRLRWKEL